jgi:hypothetical protein
MKPLLSILSYKNRMDLGKIDLRLRQLEGLLRVIKNNFVLPAFQIGE